MKIKTLVATITVALGLAFATVINAKTSYTNSNNITLDYLTVNEGVYLSIEDSLFVSLEGSVNNAGGFYVTSSSATSVLLTGKHFENSGTVAFKSLSANALSSFKVAASGSFLNTGNMYFLISSANLVETPFNVSSMTSWTNSGMMFFQTDFKISPTLYLGKIQSGVSSITNSRVICLSNIDWLTTTSIYGSGCISVGVTSKLEFQMFLQALHHSISKTQTIYLASSSSSLTILGLAFDSDSFVIIKVAGFGGGNIIEVDYAFTKHTYDDITGILRLLLSPLSEVGFKIGQGYDYSLLKVSKDGQGIFYDGPAPKSRPDECSCISLFF
ncbi:hypothetical protein METBIDRAFT_13435 [Metschnikowia bicuspidata var. bicuspidata NRRL YB-4993]|uniref:Hyphally-regulated cell wall protein N-terminal domain-containing protein n=1 Tax=Metschnikowia bicuspidata var. bicuspidata NRRL YB-4993 TaxID=869754 RepID=A0A1A0H714_9ASCO|nr:hypothetical protein METBIDRAFT_13435 [Metschnikowia bicuspidata var. bicuspidata NRRL YB-4993]OBA19697.1 hypothetical protein METBIDRAFT_13435 [Metschnikowia bicuspidata var. bicuspidata NRRL YB-4993]